MLNSFDTDVAVDVGINAAILYKNIQFWCEHNRTNGTNYNDGFYWTYNSLKAFCEQFPYMSEKQIRTALSILEEKGYIVSGNYNKVTYDRTKWYADKRADCICPTGQIETAKKANGITPQGEPIPDINTDIKPNNLVICNSDKPKGTRFIPPSVEEVKAYCDERNNDVDPEKFVAYYSSNGWRVGKNPMKDWKAAVRTWERNSYGKPLNKAGGYKSGGNEFTALLEEMEADNE